MEQELTELQTTIVVNANEQLGWETLSQKPTESYVCLSYCFTVPKGLDVEHPF